MQHFPPSQGNHPPGGRPPLRVFVPHRQELTRLVFESSESTSSFDANGKRPGVTSRRSP